MFMVALLNHVILSAEVSGVANTVMQRAGPPTAGASSVYDKCVVFDTFCYESVLN